MRSRASALLLCVLGACVPPRPRVTASLQVAGDSIRPRDRAALAKLLEAAKIDVQEVDVRRVARPYPLPAGARIHAQAAIWVAGGRIVGLFLRAVDPSERCGFRSLCTFTGWLSGRSVPRFPGLARIAALTELRTLRLHGFPQAKLDGVDRVRELRQLVVTWSGLRSLAGVGRLKHLRLLDLSGNALVEVGEVTRLTKLGILDLRHNRIVRLPDLTPLHRLHRLEIAHNPLEQLDLAALGRVGRLAAATRRLDLTGFRLRNMRGIEAFSELRRLELGGDRLQSLEGLRGLQRLRYLSISYSSLRRLQVPGRLPQLRRIDAVHSAITRVDVSQLPALEFLVLSHNRIRDLACIRVPPSLKHLDLSDNPVASFDGLEQLVAPVSRVCIELYRTPLSNTDPAALRSLEAHLGGRAALSAASWTPWACR